jgi:hypothetical protein
MRWTTYNRLMDKLAAANGIADERLVLLAARWLGNSTHAAQYDVVLAQQRKRNRTAGGYRVI